MGLPGQRGLKQRRGLQHGTGRPGRSHPLVQPPKPPGTRIRLFHGEGGGEGEDGPRPRLLGSRAARAAPEHQVPWSRDAGQGRAGPPPPGAHVRLPHMEKRFVLSQPHVHGASARLRPKLMFSSSSCQESGEHKTSPGPCQGGSARRPRPRAHRAPVPGGSAGTGRGAGFPPQRCAHRVTPSAACRRPVCSQPCPRAQAGCDGPLRSPPTSSPSAQDSSPKCRPPGRGGQTPRALGGLCTSPPASRRWRSSVPACV